MNDKIYLSICQVGPIQSSYFNFFLLYIANIPNFSRVKILEKSSRSNRHMYVYID